MDDKILPIGAILLGDKENSSLIQKLIKQKIDIQNFFEKIFEQNIDLNKFL